MKPSYAYISQNALNG